MNAIVVLTANADFLVHQLRNLPKLNCAYIVCTEDRAGINVVHNNIISSYDVLEEFAKICDTSFLHDYTMGMNILLQWYLFKHFEFEKVLFIEDDMLIFDGVDDIFKEDCNCFYHWPLSSYMAQYDTLNTFHKNMVKEWSRIFDFDEIVTNTTDVYTKAKIASGQRLYVRNRFDVDDYEKCLVRFFESNVFAEAWAKRKTHRTYYLDETFEGMYAYTRGMHNNKMNAYTKIEIAHPENVNFSAYKFKKPLWHNATVNQKKNWYEKLKEGGKIK